MVAVIMAGGKGTRIRSINAEVPKPMIPVCGKPILEYQIEGLYKNGIIKFIIVVGYLGNVIKRYFVDGSKWNVSISYLEEKEPLGTAGSLYLLKNVLKEDFLVLNGDIIFDIDLARFCKFHKNKRGIATLFTHPNNHPYDSAIIDYDYDMRIKNWYHKEELCKSVKNCVNAGLHLFNTDIFKYFKELKKADLDRDILKPLLSVEKIYAYNSPEYVKDMGTPDRFYQVEQDIKSRLTVKRNLLNKQKAIFIDRDGTINKYKGFIKDAEDIELIEGAADAIRLINRSEYLAVVITNQPVIARGECTFEELEKIHNRLEWLLGKEGAYLDAIYYCPHHPDRGFLGEIKKYKINCECRKPKTGLFIKAVQDLNIDVAESYMIGDSDIDIEAGKNAGCKNCFLVNETYNLMDCVEEIQDCLFKK